MKFCKMALQIAKNKKKHPFYFSLYFSKQMINSHIRDYYSTCYAFFNS